ncbi:ATP-binding protein [Deinococcus deserti]|uniref:histidine kinase n=1 Tax=Deinococcus deserti (strain DSM 17065 / CIP 109153 / LMG 22923 / VCD115) TaxID=546414 RepID=C1D206_DEIDV|nr:ATP-binding protein [Deinococcus deserti]ACO47445.2 putative histidine kinase-like ATPase [Deinococcus deserti VCD115]
MPDHEHHIASEIQALQQQINTLEADLQACQHQGMTLFSEAPAPYVLLNSQGRIQDVNRAATGLLGRHREVLLGRHFSQFLTPASQGSFELLLGQAVGHGLSRRGEAQLNHADGSMFDVLLDLDAEHIDGEFQRFRLVITDITAYKQAHAGLLDNTAAQQEQLEVHSARIRELNQELEQIVTVFIQQLHLPLTRALNFLGLTRRALGEVADEVNQPLLNTERAVQQIIALMASIERFMQMRSMRVRLRSVDLNSVLREVRKHSRPLMADRNIDITSEPLPTVQGDSRALYLILDEYISNALKFTKEKDPARIHVRVQESESEYHIGVEDNGAGFNMRQKDQLFRLFGRLHSSKVYEGSGVGLMTVRRACMRFGGRVWAEGKVNQGATFWFAWPKQPVIRD